MPTTPEPAIRAHGTVRVSLPAKVAYNPDALKKSLTSILDRLGCPRCFSGANCLFVAERNFVFDPGGAVALNPQPLPPGGSHATVALAPGIRYDIDKVFKAIDAVIKGLGPCPCHSGIDVLYQSELPVLGINEKGELQHFG
jgi:hypothetical protein